MQCLHFEDLLDDWCTASAFAAKVVLATALTLLAAPTCWCGEGRDVVFQPQRANFETEGECKKYKQTVNCFLDSNSHSGRENSFTNVFAKADIDLYLITPSDDHTKAQLYNCPSSRTSYFH